MQPSNEPIAIVGISCLFPESENLQEYWSTISQGKDHIKEIPLSHWSIKDYFDENPKAPDKTYAKTGGFLKPYPFDPIKYGITPSSLEATDTTQLLGMVVAQKALDDAGYGNEASFNRDRVSCILGVTGTLEMVIPLGARLGHPAWKKSLSRAGLPGEVIDEIIEDVGSSFVGWQEASFPGLLGNVVAGRIANRLNLGGTNSVVDAACASSLSAIRTAVMELQTHRADMAITGGMDTFNDIFMYMCFSKTPALSPTGSAKPFDAQGDGTVLGEGLGAVILKRLSDAERDHDRIYGTIKAIGSSSDGKGKAIYAPSSTGQVKALDAAYGEANVSPCTIELVECHGTGTKVGDGIELESLNHVFRKAKAEGQWCTLGSVKSQIGHTKAAAGVAGLIKAVLALYHKVLPPTIKVESPHPQLISSPFIIRDQPCPWPKNQNHPRRAAVSAFGFGGSNFHAVLEEYGDEKPLIDWQTQGYLLLVSSESQKDMLIQLDSIAKEFPEHEDATFLAALREKLRGQAKLRLAIFTREWSLLKTAIAKAAADIKAGGQAKGSDKVLVFYSDQALSGKIAVLFSGQGAQYPNMLSSSISQIPWAPAMLSKARSLGGSSFHHAMFPGQHFSQEEAKKAQSLLAKTSHAQPALGLVSAAIWRQLQDFGAKADMFGGHSFGELTACYAAGCFDEETLLELAFYRGQLMDQADGENGGMTVLSCAHKEAHDLLSEGSWNLVVANDNAPTQVVIAGQKSELDQFENLARSKGISFKRLVVGGAFHSPIMKAAVQPFYDRLSNCKFESPQSRVYSNVSAKAYGPSVDDLCKGLSDQLAQEVRFVDEIRQMHEDGARTFIEIGPSTILSKLVRQILPQKDIKVFSYEQKGFEPYLFDLILGKLFVSGCTIDWSQYRKDWQSIKDPVPQFSVPICGANYRSPSPASKLISKNLRIVSDEPAARPQQSIEGAKKMEKFDSETAPGAAPSSESKVTQGPGQLWKAQSSPLEKHLLAIQEMQMENAALHKQFLENQSESQKIFYEVLKLYQKDVDGVQPSISKANANVAAANISSLDQGMDTQAESSPPVDFKRPLAPEVKTAPVESAPVLHEVPEMESSAHEEELATESQESPEEGPDSFDQIEAKVLDIIAEKTGYPVASLNSSMSLEDDLGIDSIKRVEIISSLQEVYPILEGLSAEQLGEIASINELVLTIDGDSIEELTEEPEQPEETNQEQGAQLDLDDQDVMAHVLSTVSSKTGYPLESLDAGMSLEEDLGIDSIKRVEILSALGETFTKISEADQDELGEINTIEDLVSFVHGGTAPLSPENIVEDTTEPAEDLPEASELVEEIKLDTAHDIVEEELTSEQDQMEASEPESKISLVKEVLTVENTEVIEQSPLKLPEAARIWVSDDGSNLARNIVLKLRERGFKPKLVSISFVERMEPPENLDGLIILGPLKLEGSPSRFLQNCFKLVRLCSAAMKSEGPKLLTTISRNEGMLGLSGVDNLSQVFSGSLAGLTKTARAEWSHVRCLHLDLGRDFADGFEAATRLIDTCLNHDLPEIGVHSNHYSLLRLAEDSTLILSKPRLNEDDVILVTGGSRGVTFVIAKAMLESFKCKLLIWGRTDLEDELPDFVTGEEDDSELKKKILDHGLASKPKEIQKYFSRIRNIQEGQANLKALQEIHPDVVYQSVDCASEAEMRHHWKLAESELGPITGVIHGAGVLADKLIEEVSDEDFSQVVETKVRILPLLEKHLDQFKILTMFSSSTARFGRKGQAAYAIANEALNKFVQLTRRHQGDCLALSFNWGPWDGGMVDEELKKLFALEGLGLIPMDQGAHFFIDELSDGRYSELVLLAKPDVAAIPEENLITLETWPILKSHVIKSKGVVPAVLLIESMIAAAQEILEEEDFLGFKDFKLLKGITVGAGDSFQFRISCHQDKKKDGVSLVNAVFLSMRHGEGKWFPTASLTVMLGTKDSKIPDSDIFIACAEDIPEFGEIYDDYLFHGEDLQGITGIRGLSTEGISGTTLASPAPDFWLKDPLINSWFTDPLAIDVAFQLAVIWGERLHGNKSLPIGIKEYKQFQAFPPEGCEIRIRVSSMSSHQFIADMEFVKDEQVIASLSGYEAVMDASLAQSFRLNEIVEPESTL